MIVEERISLSADVQQILLERERVFRVGEIELDPIRHRVSRDQVPVRLTPTEFELLRTLMSEAGKPVSHRALLTAVWGPSYAEEREYLRTYIHALRKKLEEHPSSPRHILTEKRLGYRFAIS